MTAHETPEQLARYERSQRFGYCTFEIDPMDATLWGWISASVYEGGRPEGHQDPVDIITTNEDLWVKVRWRLAGHLIRHLCGYFCVCVHFESIGPGPEITADCDNNGRPCQYVEMNPCGDGYYEMWCRIPGGQLTPGRCGTVYEVAVTLTSLNPCKEPGHIRAFCKDFVLVRMRVDTNCS